MQSWGVSVTCFLPRFNGTAAAPGSNTVVARYDQLVPAVGTANYAAAAIFNDFTLAGAPDTLVNTQISTTFDFNGEVFGAGAYKGAATLSMRVSDMTAGGVQIATHTLFEQERSGDHGISDVTGGSETQALVGSNSSFFVQLRRGRTYRLTFEVEVLGEALIVGKTISSGAAVWNGSLVSIDEDEVELLSLHDAGVHRALARHDADIKRELAEIHRKLDEQAAQLAEIKRLLLTPQGRRDGFPLR
jgi:hypothetical protein